MSKVASLGAGAQECWEWDSKKNNRGYGVFWNGTKGVLAHRFAYEMWVGPIPAGLQLDHLCRNRGCVRPDHLEPVTNQENGLRGQASEVTRMRRAEQTHCAYGHPLPEERNGENKRMCRPCIARRSREYRARLKG
jgi:hypothetical protein